MNAKENTLKLLSLLLLTELLALSSAEAFFGWGKYPSKMDAREACEKWIDNGPTRTVNKDVSLPSSEKASMYKKAREEYEKAMAGIRNYNRENPNAYEDQNKRWIEGGRRGINPGLIDRKDIAEKLYAIERSSIERATRKMDVEVPIRKCRYEGTTRQFIGIDENSKKYFRY